LIVDSGIVNLYIHVGLAGLTQKWLDLGMQMNAVIMRQKNLFDYHL
jgi:hypothetical protein